jgi:hypothetical protein
MAEGENKNFLEKNKYIVYALGLLAIAAIFL